VTLTDYAEIVAALRAVPGVADADVEPDDEGGGLGLLRLGLAPGVDEVEVATSVGRLLRERFGLGVDADRVQLVEDTAGATPIEEEPEPSPLGARGRPIISRMQLVSSGLDVTAIVTMRYHAQVCTGECTGTATQTGVQRAVATATLRALEDLVARKARFELEHVEVTNAGRQRAAFVSVTMLSGAGSERLTGSATVREDIRQACIRATLDAVNRRLGPLLG
jgi:hypothetical protein